MYKNTTSCDCDPNSYELRHSHECSSRSDSPIAYTTEVERVKLREQYVAIAKHIPPYTKMISPGLLFDTAFPPVTPPKIVPLEGWARVDESGHVYALSILHPSSILPAGHRAVRIRVEEIEE